MIAAARIRRLSQVVADAIAAGEVIERPASVVKELLENAIDAGTTRVEIDVDGGGLVRIQVVDDGCGIESDDLELAVTRHATSKIEAAADLHGIRSLGFRGEALASMAAVAEVRITSRTAGEPAATELRVRGGEIVERAARAAPVGTTVEVCELFATTPARLRFLRTAAAESAAAGRVVAELALAHPELSIVSRADGKVTLRSSGGSLQDALRAVYGPRAAQELVDVGSSGDIGVRGAISAPHAHRASRSGLVMVVNGRRVQSRALIVAVEEAYRGLLPAGRHPYGVIVVELDPASLDVNVHPAKREVRFRDERAVFAAVQRACWQALRVSPASQVSSTAWTAPAAAPSNEGLTLNDTLAGFPPATELATPVSTTLAELAPLQSLGQSGGQWIVAVGGDAIVLVDPHAAHEKVLYARLTERWSTSAPAETQLLLLPAIVECDSRRMEAWERFGPDIAQCGFALEPFGPGMLRCTGVPAGSGDADAAQMASELLDALVDSEGSATTRRHRMAALVACHSAVRFGDRLDPAAQQRLLDQLVETPGGMTCPHGRPTVLVMRDAELRRAFRRPQG